MYVSVGDRYTKRVHLTENWGLMGCTHAGFYADPERIDGVIKFSGSSEFEKLGTADSRITCVQ